MCEELGIEYSTFLKFINDPQQFNISPPITNVETPLFEAIDMFITQLNTIYRLRKISFSTVKLYVSIMSRFKSFLAQQEKEYSISTIDEVIFSEFLLQCRQDPDTYLSERTQNTYTAVVRRFLGFCSIKELTYKDHRFKLNFLRVELLPRYFPDTQLNDLLREALQRREGYKWHTLFCFLIGTGCRVSEAINIRVRDVDIEDKIIHIYKGKGKKDRIIPLYPEVLTLVLQYLNFTGIKKWERNQTGYLFTHGFENERGSKLSIRSIERMVSVICRKLNFLENYTVHSFRHTFAIRCLKAGMKIEYLSQIMGHSDPKTTYIYLQMLPVDLQKEISEKYPFAFEQLLFNIFSFEE